MTVSFAYLQHHKTFQVGVSSSWWWGYARRTSSLCRRSSLEVSQVLLFEIKLCTFSMTNVRHFCISTASKNLQVFGDKTWFLVWLACIWCVLQRSLNGRHLIDRISDWPNPHGFTKGVCFVCLNRYVQVDQKPNLKSCFSSHEKISICGYV